MKITRKQLRKIIQEGHPRAFVDDLLMDYEEYVEAEGHVTPAASSVAASFFLQYPGQEDNHEAHQVIADEFGLDHQDIMRDIERQRKEKPMGESTRITKGQLRKLIREAMPKGGAPDVMGAMGGGKFQPRNYDVLDYEDWVKEEGHVTAASSSVMATYFLSQGIESQGLMKKLADHFKIDFRDVMRDYDRQEAEGNVVRGEGVLRISGSKLRKIISESILKETQTTFHSRRSVPRSVQADYDIANKEDTFPKAKPSKGPSPALKTSYEMINQELTKALETMPGYRSLMSGEAAYIDAKRKEVVEILKPIAAKIGAEVKDGHADETFIRHPDGVMVTVFGSGTGTEVDFGPTPGS